MKTVPNFLKACSRAAEMVVAAVLFTGCTTSYRLVTVPEKGAVTFDQLQYAVEGEEAILTLKDRTVSGKIQSVRTDSIIFEPSGQARQSVAFSDISTVQYIGIAGRFRGMFDWFAIGAVAGGVVGNYISPNTGGGANKGSGPGLGVGFGVLIGVAGGAVVGLIIGHKYEYRLKEEPEK